jgi:putative PIN family toxin of toxin-antitoxin system
LSQLVLDANILLAALAGRPQASPALLLAGVHNGDFEAIACPALIAEVRGGLRKPYFRARLTELEGQEAIDAYADLAVMLPDPVDPEPVLRDPTDDYLVALGRSAAVRAIVTGDKDLLEHPGLRPPAIDARAACELTSLVEPR